MVSSFSFNDINYGLKANAMFPCFTAFTHNARLAVDRLLLAMPRRLTSIRPLGRKCAGVDAPAIGNLHQQAGDALGQIADELTREQIAFL